MRFAVAVLGLLALPASTALANGLLEELGRSETRVWSEPFAPEAGGTVAGYRLAERLQRQGYERVRARPQTPGEYFWGHEVFWIYRRAHRLEGVDLPPVLFGLDLDAVRRDGTIVAFRNGDGEPLLLAPRLEPELLSESLDGDRSRRRPLRFASLPEHVWRPLLAAEDARFFDHPGLDGKALARALLANLRAGETVQGGSTLTQQLIKNRELTPKRSLGRKMSEAVRSLAVEAEYSKEEILEAYLATVYLGHQDGLAIHGYGTAAQVYFGRPAEDLDLVQAATLAAMIQAPNRLDPRRHAERLKARRDWVLERMEELEWSDAATVARAKAQPVRVALGAAEAPAARHFLAWLRDAAQAEAPRRMAQSRGLVVESTLDPMLQEQAEASVVAHLGSLRRRYPELQTALVTLDARTGAVLAYVGGDPGVRAGFDRARNARRQPGSAIKPLLLLQAFDDCDGEPLHAASRVADQALLLDLPSGPWQPTNSDGRFRGVVSIRLALRHSLNVPFVRIAEHCGREAMASTLRRAGLDLPSPVPPSFALGAVETTPLRLAQAYTSLADGKALVPRPWRRMERPGGRRLGWQGVEDTRVASPEAAFLVRHLLTDVADLGTARAAQLQGVEVAAKTGTTSDRRDAWLAGLAQGLVTVVWVGRDDDLPHGLSGAEAAAPLWRAYMEQAVKLRPPHGFARPGGIEVRWIDPQTGLRVGRGHRRAEPEVFRDDAKPRRKRWWRKDSPAEIIL